MTRHGLVLFLFFPSVALAGATASAFKPEHRKGANLYNAGSAVDNDPATCWMVPGESPNRGEWIMIDVPKSTIDKIGMYVGWARDKDTWDDYARVKKIKIDVINVDEAQNPVPGGTATVEFKDQFDWQIVDINPDLEVGRDLFGGKVKITIADVYEGKDFPNLAMSDLMFYLKEFETQITPTSESNDPNHPLTALQDDNPKTFWTAPAGNASFSFPTQGFGISSLVVQAGPKDYSRPKKIAVTANNRTLTTELLDTDKPQVVTVPSLNGYTGGAFGEITVQVVETWPGAKDPSVAIAEIQAMASNYEGF